MNISFGALAPALSEQLADSGLTTEQLEHFDKDADAILRLRIRGYLTDSAYLSAFKKLMKAIERKLAEKVGA
jgi:hypothetical protein